MIIKKYKPTSPGIRHLIRIKNNSLYKGKPYKKFLVRIKRTGGRNNTGKITTRHIGGGHKKLYRIIDFKRNKDNILAKVIRFEYDPNRSSNIALICYKDGVKKYILLPKKLNIGDYIISSKKTLNKIGNCMELKNIQIGSIIHNIEIYPKNGGKLSRSAGSYAQLLSHEKKYSVIKLKSGEIRKILSSCRATIGEVSNSEHSLISLGKAGLNRWLGNRPTVRGTAMNPIDHPHGGGEGKNFGKHPVTPWGKKTKGKKTRKKNISDKFIISKRNK